MMRLTALVGVLGAQIGLAVLTAPPRLQGYPGIMVLGGILAISTVLMLVVDDLRDQTWGHAIKVMLQMWVAGITVMATLVGVASLDEILAVAAPAFLLVAWDLAGRATPDQPIGRKTA